MAAPFTHSRRVEFRDTDMAGIVHFSVYFVYMEQAEHEFLRSLGLNVVSESGGRKISWPRVSATCDFCRAVRYDQIVDIAVSVKRLGNKSVTYGFAFTADGELVAEGSIAAACCVFDHGRPPEPIEIPAEMREKLGPFVIASQD